MMKKIKLVEINSSLDYGEVAYFIKTNENDFLCIYYTNEKNSDKTYIVGNIYDLEEVKYDEIILENQKNILEKSELFHTFLFNEFLRNLRG